MGPVINNGALASGALWMAQMADGDGKSRSGNLLQTWGRLLRVPNLFTVPGDPIAGFLLASGGIVSWGMAWAAVVSLCLYAAGLLLNDFFDRDVDARERPERPIPSGAARANTVLAAGLGLLVGGVALGFGLGHPGVGAVAIAVALAIVGYDAGLKRIPWLGQIVMGSCRAGSVVLGAAFAHAPMAPAVVIAAAVAWAYTTSLTLVAAGETSERRPGWAAHVPGLVLLAGGIAMLRHSMGKIQWPLMTCVDWDPCCGGETTWFVDRAGVVAALLLVLAIGEAEWSAFRVRQGSLPTPAFIGRLIRVMITVQAAWVVWTLGPLLGRGQWEGAAACVVVACLALRWLAGLTARRFYGS